MKHLSLFLLPLLLAGCIPLKPPAKGNELDASGRAAFLSSINTKRANAATISCVGGAGLGYADPETFAAASPNLIWNAKLETAALNNATFLAANEFNIASGDPHNGAGNGNIAARVLSAGYNLSSAGETIARGQSTSDAVAQDWQISSNAHCNIMLDKTMKDIGAASVTSPSGQKYWVMVVGRVQP
jgi:Cysteine-rich secretory protein family